MTLASQLTRGLFRGLRLLDVPALRAELRFRELRHRYYGRYWPKVAREVGASCVAWDFGFQRLTRNGTTVIVRGPEVRLDDHLTLELMGNKLLTFALMAEHGFDVPRHARFSLKNMQPALDLLNTSGRPLVVKPLAGSGGGRGVTTGITDSTALKLAALSASRFDPDLLVEEQLEGHSYRLLYLDGQMIDAIRRDPPRVTGDGLRTIAALVDAENRKRLDSSSVTALSPLMLDRDAKLYLKAQGLTHRSVPAAGETVIVKRAVNQNSRDENHVIRGDVHPATVVACARLTARLGVRLAGVDIIAHDIAKPLSRANGMIGEINTTPGLHHHDLVANPHDGLSPGAVLAEHLLAQDCAWPVKDKGSTVQLRVAAG